jgi:Leucine-rich repeat (LRR) protein
MPISITVDDTTHYFKTIEEMVSHHDYDRATKMRIILEGISELPALPASLTELVCGGNQLTSLSELPASLTELYFHNNQLTSLPELPASLTMLNCYDNKLTSLPALPASLTTLNCGENHLTSIPALPESLSVLYYHGNEIELTLLQVNQINAMRERRAASAVSGSRTVYGDSQNVHASSVSASLLRSVEALMA